uniref:Sushi repeat-containing protein SRPX2 n=1 Tax=Fundulus heteroclitus TaxID=8078 RepID=A0A3Q2PRN5_FUNHE
MCFLCVSAGATTDDDSYSDFIEDDNTPQLDYKDPNWCRSLQLSNGEVTCRPPRGGAHRGMLGTRCGMTCDRGYRLLGRRSIQCLANRLWSGTAYCRKIRCYVLPLIPHGRYTCTQGFFVDSRCDFTCRPGYRIEGEHSRTCQPRGSWSGVQPECSDTDPPKIKCPPSRLKVADPGKLTARVSWDPPAATDTADKFLKYPPGTDFKEGLHVIRYKVYDQARNRAACKFIVRVEVRRCPELPPPLHGYLSCSSDGNNYGAECEYLCDGGYERRGTSSRVCQFNRSWSGAPAECVREYRVTQTTQRDTNFSNHETVLLLIACFVSLYRQVFRISRSYFSMVLLDELGVDRERFIVPVSSDELFSYIDGFLLEEEERERLELHRDFCE